jgi:hypothetical protein
MLLDTLPWLPDINENIKVMYLSASTISLIQSVDQGVISTLDYYVWKTFAHLVKVTDGEGELSVKDFWRNFDIRSVTDITGEVYAKCHHFA